MKVEFDYPVDIKELCFAPESYAVTADVTADGECYISKVMLLIAGNDINVESMISDELREVFKDEAMLIVSDTKSEWKKCYRHVQEYA